MVQDCWVISDVDGLHGASDHMPVSAMLDTTAVKGARTPLSFFLPPVLASDVSSAFRERVANLPIPRWGTDMNRYYHDFCSETRRTMLSLFPRPPSVPKTPCVTPQLVDAISFRRRIQRALRTFRQQ
eukprot:9158193-Pyramimonas_sp.AAC.1